MVTHCGFIHRRKSWNHLADHNKLYHMKVLLSGFHLNGHSLGFHPQTLKLNTEILPSIPFLASVCLSQVRVYCNILIFSLVGQFVSNEVCCYYFFIRDLQRKQPSCINEQTTSDKTNHNLVSLLAHPAVNSATTTCENTRSLMTVCLESFRYQMVESSLLERFLSDFP